MRDILTVIAALVILVLAAAVVAPPLIDWDAHRDLIDRAISRASGTEARTEGRIRVRLLPSPLIRVDKLRLGTGAPDSPSLAADIVRAEIALTPLLRGDVRFTQAQVGRAEIRVPVAPDGRWSLPPDLVGNSHTREWSIENLAVSQLLLTTQVPSTGRTDQFYAEGVQIAGQKLIGPWRVEGVTAGVPFRLATSELTSDKTVQLKLSGGGDSYPRFDVDAKLALDAGDATQPALSGKAKVLFGPPAQAAAAGIPIPVAIDTAFKTSGQRVELDAVTVEAGEGGASLRLNGTGSIQLDDPRIALKLEGRRLDADSFILSSNGQDFMSRLRGWALPPIRVPIDLDLSINSIGLAQDELSNATLRASVLKGRIRVERLELKAPGETRVALQGEAGLTTEGGGSGRVAVASTASDRFARYLERLGLRGPALAVLDGRPFEAATDVAVGLPVISFRNMRVKSGDAVLTGNLRYTAPEGATRGRLEAQVAVQGLDLNQLPQVSSIFDATQNLDVGFILDAQDVRAGNRGGVGRISARILSDGPALLVETLDIVDLAGANARVSGRILPDGSGRIAGKVTARRAAPLVDLLGSVWIGGVSKLVPYFLREGELDLDVVTERAAPEPGSTELRLRTTVKGTAAGGAFESEALTADGATQNLNVRLATDNTGRWVDRPDVPVLRRPSRVTLQGTRVGSGVFNVTLSGDIGGVRIETNRPFALSASDDVVDSGEADITTQDVTPFLVLLGDGAGVEPPVPAQARITLGRERDASLLAITGRVANDAVQARLAVRSRADISGTVTLDRLSMPWLVTTFALNAPADPRATSLWSSVRFGQSGRLISGGQVAFKVARLELGRGLQGENASFNLSATSEGITIRDLNAGLGGGQLIGQMAVTRQGTLASVVGEGALRNVGLTALAGPSPIDARLSANLKFGSAAETFAGLVSNLGGAGDLRLTDLRVTNADPAALERALQRLLQESDPLAVRRAESVVAEELNRGPLTATSLTAPVAVVAGGMRLSPVIADGGPAVWQGAIAFDFKNLTLDARGTLAGKTIPKRWVGSPPSINLAWRGPLANPVREIETGVLTNGLAAIVLQRELEKIEVFETEANERQRRQQRLQMDRQRERDRLAFEEAARQARLKEEAERARVEAQRARAEAERVQAEQRARAEADGRTLSETPPVSPLVLPPSLAPAIELKPPPQIFRPGG